MNKPNGMRLDYQNPDRYGTNILFNQTEIGLVTNPSENCERVNYDV